MGISICLNKKLIDIAKSYSIAEHRSVSAQIEHWVKIGCIVEKNKDLTYDDIQGILLGLADFEAGNVYELKH